MDPQAPLLLRKASEDRAALVYDLPDGIFGFLAQQAFEKLLKSLIAANGETFDRTHDLDVLFKHITSLGEGPLPLPYPLLTLQRYAVVFRYSDADPILSKERQQIREAIDALTEYVRSRLHGTGASAP
jgi:HEPN domain-containing protein